MDPSIEMADWEANRTFEDEVRDLRELLANLDEARINEMTALYYMNGFDELRIAAEGLLRALDRRDGREPS